MQSTICLSSEPSPEPSGSTGMNLLAKGLWTVAGLFLLLVVTTVLFGELDLDRKIQSQFYCSDRGWFLKETQPWRFIYRYGTIPGLVLTLAALIGFCHTYVTNCCPQWRRSLLLVVLTTVIAAGFLVNGTLKTFWGRPRPKQVTEYGGQFEYRHIYDPGAPGMGKSFPCGHATMGFIFVTFLFFHTSPRWLIWGGTLLGLGYGTLVSIGRMVQGAHFATDAIWALGLVVIISTLLHYATLHIPALYGQQKSPLSRTAGLKLAAGTVVLILAIVAIFMTRRPFYETYRQAVDLSVDLRPHAPALELHTNVSLEGIRLKYRSDPEAQILLHAYGFGFPNVMHQLNSATRQEDRSTSVFLMVSHSGYFAELNHHLELWLPDKLRDKIKVVREPL